VPVQERKTEILVFDPQGPPDVLSPWKLMHKAKDAVISANPRLDTFQLNPQALFEAFLNFNFPELSCRFCNLQRQICFILTEVEVEVEDVFDNPISNGQDSIARFDPYFLGN
jgi:hypothetical protein